MFIKYIIQMSSTILYWSLLDDMSMLFLQIESDASTVRVWAAQIESASAQIESDTVMHRFPNSSRSTWIVLKLVRVRTFWPWDVLKVLRFGSFVDDEFCIWQMATKKLFVFFVLLFVLGQSFGN